MKNNLKTLLEKIINDDCPATYCNGAIEELQQLKQNCDIAKQCNKENKKFLYNEEYCKLIDEILGET